MFEPTRGGTRGGQAEFKWSDVGADKDRENYLGHSINAPTGRWQKNKDVHWYARDKHDTEEERQAEIRQLKEAEAEAMSVALGFEPSKAQNGTASGANAVPVTGANAAPMPPSAPLDTTDLDPDAALAKEEKRRRKEERRAHKEQKHARKEERRVRREDRERRREDRDRDWSRSRSPVRYRDDDGRRNRTRSRSPPPRRDDGRRPSYSPTRAYGRPDTRRSRSPPRRRGPDRGYDGGMRRRGHERE